MATEAQRTHAVHVMDFLHAHGSSVLYPPGDQRDNRDATSWHLTEQQLEHVILNGGLVQFDCSETVPWVLRCSGLWHVAAPGYTGSHMQMLPRYHDPRQAYRAAICVYGIDTKPDGHHEAMVHTPDPKTGNPLMMEHGSNRVVALTRHRDIVARQTANGYPGSVWLSIAHL